MSEGTLEVCEAIEERKPKAALISKIGNGFIVSPGMYVGDDERAYAATIDEATAKAKEFLA